ncbi:phosphotransferase [Lentzea tibetensis]|uniref:non-specific serine/threonine protein kinase n=1 Tax=Lentzea tibetensis TaxID=2591470 RepID=A0A563EFI0_9PSEU|nr:class III lanthionine synthetase LanKC [Lentzea tibetensis]TWP44727.1 phosphotransferase [Lentzea tibetensis]
MDLRYEAYCFADSLFYDVQSLTETPRDDFAHVLPTLPSGWKQADHNIWRHVHPDGVVLPTQGWKIHVSATLRNAGQVLKATHSYCVEHRIPFKHLRTLSIVLARNSKYAPREGSGKLITIYPADETQMERILTDLSAELDGFEGAYILSDLRYGAGPLFVRYGGFVEQWLEVDGKRVLAIQDRDGTLVPDRRKPTFSLPEWVELPACLAPHLDARNNSGDPAQFPYQVTKSLHFSNGGGVYLANRKSDGKEVVLKEARPHAGLDRRSADAVSRLQHEHDTLVQLAGIPGVPEVYEHFVCWEHHFLAMELMPGNRLSWWLGHHYPLAHTTVTDEQLAEYRTRTFALVDKVERTLDAVHERGLVFGDLHAHNILLDENERLSLIDFELSFPIDSDQRPTLGAPGFQAPPDRSGSDVDDYGLAALKLWLFLPLNTMLELAPEKLQSHVDFIRRRFDLPDEYCDSIIDVLTPRTSIPAATHIALDDEQPDWTVVRKAIATAILASATPHREDRLFPGDVEQFEFSPAAFAYGASGVLHALHASGEGRFPEYEQWLLDAVRREPPKEPGFYAGAHGIAHVLENFGYSEQAADLVAEYAPMVDETQDHSLRSGLAGIGLNLLHFAHTRQDRDFLAQAIDLGDRTASMLPNAEPPGDKGRAGLFLGWSGPALFFVRLFEHTGDRAWLDHAERALDRDLEECELAVDGTLQVHDGDRTLPYVEVGGAGIALVLDEYARHVPDAPPVAKLPDLVSSCGSEYVSHPGLGFGRMGLLGTLAQVVRRQPDPVFEKAIERHLRALAWHAVSYENGITFPGYQLRRLSMDLMSGAAGVLLTVASTLDQTGRMLPFLGVQPQPADALAASAP